jgi:ribosomal protein L30, bacterial/organelle
MPKKTEVQKEKILRITWIRSAIGYSVQHKATIRALGLRKLHQTVEHKDGPALRGMLEKVSHMVQVEEQVEK